MNRIQNKEGSLSCP
ncbi:MAG: tetracycline resistance efflux system leader peptide [Spirochaetia bacterium]